MIIQGRLLVLEETRHTLCDADLAKSPYWQNMLKFARVGEMAHLCTREANTLPRDLNVVASLGVLLPAKARIISPFFAVHPVDANIPDSQQNTSKHTSRGKFVGERNEQNKEFHCMAFTTSFFSYFPPSPRFMTHALVCSFFFLMACRMLSLMVTWVNSWTCMCVHACVNMDAKPDKTKEMNPETVIKKKNQHQLKRRYHGTP